MKMFLINLVIIFITSPVFSASVLIGKDTICNGNEFRKNNKYISVGVVFMNFSPTQTASDMDMKSRLINIGAETLFCLEIKPNMKVSSGFYYQMGKIERASYPRRVRFDEINIPILFSASFVKSKPNYLSYTTGIYAGKYLNTIIETKGGKLSSDDVWVPISNIYIENFSTNNNIVDFIFGVNYNATDVRKNYFQLALFTKYRLLEHWINKDISRWSIGIKLNYNFNL